MWAKFYHFGPKNGSEKWAKKNIFEILHAEAIFF